MIAKLKVYGFAILAGALTVFGFLARIFFLQNQNTKLRQRAEHYEAKATRARIVADKDNELEAQARSRRSDAKKEIETDSNSSVFRNPDGLWNDTDSG